MANYLKIFLVTSALIAFAIWMPGAPTFNNAYTTIANSATPLTKRPTLNFVNGGCVDNSGANRTDCTITGGGGGGTGTVTNIATTSPISGGPITTTGTLTCPTCVVTTGSYNNPTWITALAPSKVGNGTPQWNASSLQGFGVATNTPTAGQYLAWNSGTNLYTPTAPVTGSITIDVGGSVIGTRNILNWISGTGITQSCSDNSGATRVDCTPSVNTAVIPSINAIQSGAVLYCKSSNGTNAATCTLANTGSHVLAAYTEGMEVLLNTDTTMSSTGSLNIDSLGVKTVTQKDCLTAIGGQIVAAQASRLWYNGTVFCKEN